MRKSEWREQYPAQPAHFHAKVLTTLQQLPEKPASYTGRKRIVTLITGIFVLLSVSAAIASGLSWPWQMTNQFQSEPLLQEQLTEQGMAVVDAQSVTDQNVTISFTGKVEDDNFIYLLFHVVAPDYVLDENYTLQPNIDWSEQDHPRTIPAMTWGFVENDGPQSKGIFEMWMTKDHNEDYTDTVMQLTFTALQQHTANAGIPIDLVQGTWQFQIPLTGQTTQTFNLNQQIQLDGVDITVKRIALTPVSCTIAYDGADIRQLEQKKGLSLEQCDILPQLELTEANYQDGTVIKLGTHGGTEGFQQQNTEYEKTVLFDHVLDLQQLQSLKLGNETLLVLP